MELGFDVQEFNQKWSFIIISDQGCMGFGRFERSKNSKITPLFQSKLQAPWRFCQFHSLMPIVVLLKLLIIVLASLPVWPERWLAIAGPHPKAHVQF